MYRHKNKEFAMLKRILWVAATIVALGPSAMAQTLPSYTDVTGPVLGPCPDGFQKLLPNCAIGTVTTWDGKIKSCYCNVPQAQLPARLEDFIPTGKQMEVFGAQVDFRKVVDNTNPKDPCSWVKIGGVLRYICTP